MARYRLTGPAASDLESLHAYISADNPSAADRLVRAMVENFKFLAAHPTIHPPQPALLNMHRSVVGNYLVLYRPIENGVEIVRIIHGSRDVPEVVRTYH